MATNYNNRFKLTACECGCKGEAPWNSLHPLRGPDSKVWFVLDSCRDTFQREALASARLAEIMFTVRGVPFYQRWPFAKALFLNILVINQRKDRKTILRMARRTTLLFILPQRIGLWIGRWIKNRDTKRAAKSQHGPHLQCLPDPAQ